jgi:DNA-binding MarR family transcriptional regulator
LFHVLILPSNFHLGRQLLMLERHFTGQALTLMQQRGITDINLGHFSVLPFIDDKGVRATAIAQRSGISKQAVGKTLDDLKAKGYLVSLSDPKDKRASLVRLNDQGINMMKLALTATKEVEAHWCELVGDKSVKAFKSLCGTLLSKLES